VAVCASESRAPGRSSRALRATRGRRWQAAPVRPHEGQRAVSRHEGLREPARTARPARLQRRWALVARAAGALAGERRRVAEHPQRGPPHARRRTSWQSHMPGRRRPGRRKPGSQHRGQRVAHTQGGRSQRTRVVKRRPPPNGQTRIPKRSLRSRTGLLRLRLQSGVGHVPGVGRDPPYLQIAG